MRRHRSSETQTKCFGPSSKRGLLLLVVASAGCSLGHDSESDYPYQPSNYPPPADTTFANPLAPNFGVTHSESDPPPPLSGGTLIVTRDGARAIAADPDRDRVFVVRFEDRSVVDVPLLEHDEPGRLVEDDEGTVHVVLRRGGAIVSIDPTTGAITARRAVCNAPRGIAFDAPRKQLLVACEDGQLIAMGIAATATPTRLATLDGDLRDVLASGDRIFVSRFRTAQILELGVSGKEIARVALPMRASAEAQDVPSGSTPMLAWRMIASAPSGDAGRDPIVVHEVGTPGPGNTFPDSYYGGASSGGCSSSSPIVLSAISRAGVAGFMSLLPPQAVLPVDIATDGESYAVIAAGNGHTTALPQVYLMSARAKPGTAPTPLPSGLCPPGPETLKTPGQPTSVAFRRPNAIVVQSREPATLALEPEGIIIALSSIHREDTGHAIFHSNTGTGLACASCHGEGGDDGHTWDLVEGRRRTPSLRGTLDGTAPYHWDGEVAGIESLADLVMTKRMGGPPLAVDQKTSLRSWLFAIPAPALSGIVDPLAAARGKQVFERPEIMCTSCHMGPKLASAANANVGTGGEFQVPSLIGVRTRAPFLHNGCAATLTARFEPQCGSASHGKTDRLSAAELSDMIAYLESL